MAEFAGSFVAIVTLLDTDIVDECNNHQDGVLEQQWNGRKESA